MLCTVGMDPGLGLLEHLHNTLTGASVRNTQAGINGLGIDKRPGGLRSPQALSKTGRQELEATACLTRFKGPTTKFRQIENIATSISSLIQ